MMLSNHQIEQYAEAGFIAGLQLFRKSEAAHFRTQFDQLEAEHGRDHCANKLFNPHLTNPFVWQIVSDPRLLACVAALLGDDILLLATRFFCKYGGSPQFAGWHQDAAYWQLSPASAVSVWYAIDDSHRGNGCMRMVPGTHREQLREQGRSGLRGNMLSLDQNILLSPSEEQSIVDLELESGMFSFHHGRVVHGSEPNRSRDRRCGLLCVFLPGNVRQLQPNQGGEYWSAIPVQGDATGTNLTLLETPFPLQAR